MGKLTPQMKEDILRLAKEGVPYSHIVEYLKQKYGTKVSTVTIYKTITMLKKYLVDDFLEEVNIQERVREKAMRLTLNETLEKAINYCAKVVEDLRKKYEEEGLKVYHVRLMHATLDRLIMLKKLLFPSIEVKKELSFHEKLQKELKKS